MVNTLHQAPFQRRPLFGLAMLALPISHAKKRNWISGLKNLFLADSNGPVQERLGKADNHLALLLAKFRNLEKPRLSLNTGFKNEGLLRWTWRTVGLNVPSGPQKHHGACRSLNLSISNDRCSSLILNGTRGTP